MSLCVLFSRNLKHLGGYRENHFGLGSNVLMLSLWCAVPAFYLNDDLYKRALFRVALEGPSRNSHRYLDFCYKPYD